MQNEKTLQEIADENAINARLSLLEVISAAHDERQKITTLEALGLLQANNEKYLEIMLEAGRVALEEDAREYFYIREDLRPRETYVTCARSHVIPARDKRTDNICAFCDDRAPIIGEAPLYLYRVSGALSGFEMRCLNGDKLAASFDSPASSKELFEVFTYWNELGQIEAAFDIHRNVLELERAVVLEPLAADARGAN